MNEAQAYRQHRFRIVFFLNDQSYMVLYEQTKIYFSLIIFKTIYSSMLNNSMIQKGNSIYLSLFYQTIFHLYFIDTAKQTQFRISSVCYSRVNNQSYQDIFMGNCQQQNDNYMDLNIFSDEIKFKESSQVCGSDHLIERYCYNQQCQESAAMCGNKECSSCCELHPQCSTVTVKQLKKQTEERISSQKMLFSKISAIENKLIDRFAESRRQLIQKSSFKNYFQNSLKAFESIYNANNIKQLKGREVKQLFDQLLLKINASIIDQQLQRYEYQSNSLMEEWKNNRISLQRRSIQGQFYARQWIRNDKIHQRINIQSKILAEDKQGLQKYSFLMKQLNNPSELKLLFRASQHNFAASKFHKLCARISDTVTIIRTEFNKTIAAFTPFKWKAEPQAKFVADDSKSSFLLQLELKQRMTLIQPKYAIYNHPNYGPTFGYGHDLWIADKCNQNQVSYANFPHSYNCNGKYQNSQQSWTIFCGSSNGCNFRVIEYQVFEVRK